MPFHRIVIVALVVAGCANVYPGDPPPDAEPCEWLRQKHVRHGAGLSFLGWLEHNWPNHRFTHCATERRQQAPAQLSVADRRYCYNIAITHGHMSASRAKEDDRRAWTRMGCEAFLGRTLPNAPLPADEEARYTAALSR